VHANSYSTAPAMHGATHVIAVQRAPTPPRGKVENVDGPQTTDNGERGELIEGRVPAGTCGEGGVGEAAAPAVTMVPAAMVRVCVERVARGGRAENVEGGAPTRIVDEQGAKKLAEGPVLTIARQRRGVEFRSCVEGQVSVKRTFPGILRHAKLPRLSICPLKRSVAVVKL